MEVTSYLTDGLNTGSFGWNSKHYFDAFYHLHLPREGASRRRDCGGWSAGLNPRVWQVSRLRGYACAMSQPRYREAIVDYIRAQAQPPDKFSHQPRLYHLAKRLAEGQPYDDDMLYAAAWLHDLGVFIGHRPEDPAALAAWDHVAYAAREVPEILQAIRLSRGQDPGRHRGHPDASSLQPSRRLFEGTLLRDADILEQLGAIAVLRTVSKVGRDTRFVRLCRCAAASCGGISSNCPRNWSWLPRAGSPSRASRL